MENNEQFLKRADKHILLANEQISDNVTAGQVSASFMFGLTRFNAWVAAGSFESGEEMLEKKEEVLEYFANEYKRMLEQHIDEHIKSHQFSKWSY